MSQRFISNLLHLRKVHNIKQKELADYIGKSVATISNWEASRQEPVISEFLKICEFFNIPVRDMFFTDLEEIPSASLRSLKENPNSNLKKNDLFDKINLEKVREYLDNISKTIDSIDSDL